jgi:PAS domain S-box-containing protein
MGNDLANGQSARRARSVGVVVMLCASASVLVATFLLASDHSSAVIAGTFSVRENLSLTAAAGSMLFVFLCLLGVFGYLLRHLFVAERRSEELALLAQVAGRTDHAVFFTDSEGCINWVNEGFIKMTGHALTDARGKQSATLFLGTLQNLNVVQKFREGLASQKPFVVEMLCSHRRGHRYWMSVNMTPLFDGHQTLTGFVGVGSDITARRRAEDEVAKIGKRSELLLNAAGDGILGIDVQGAITFVNSAAARLTGWPAAELIGKPVSSILHQLRLQRTAAPQDDLFTGAAFIDGTVSIGDADEFKARDGTAFPVEYTSTPVHEGTILIGSVVVFRDITDRCETDALRTRQARQSALRADVAFGLTNGDSLRDFLHCAMQCVVKHLDGAYARVWTLSSDGDMLELQASAGIYTHLDGQHSRIPVGTLKVGKIAKERMPAVSSNLATDPDIIDKDWVTQEKLVAFIGFPLFVEGRLVGVMAMFSRNKLPVDAVELMGCIADTVAQGIVRKQTEEKVVEQAALLDRSRDAIVMVDLNNRCTYWNKSAERMHGWETARSHAPVVNELVFAEATYFERAKACTIQHGEWQDPDCLIRRGNEVINVDSRWTLLTDDSGKPRGMLVVNTDVSERKKIEAQFLRTQRMESIGTLAGGIAHDLNNVLSPIMMSVDVLKEKVSDTQGRRMLAILETSTRRGAEMVKQVLTFARGVEGERVQLQTRHLLRDVAKMVGETFPKTIQFRSQIPESLWVVNGDATQLHQVLVNLAVNARDAMPNGGALTLSAENYVLESDIQHQGAMILPGFFVMIRVTDTGTGISPDVLDKIFDPFFTTKEQGKGTGLGLSTVLGIVKSHGGFVQVQTEVGRGTTFVVCLPAQEGVQVKPVESSASEMPLGNGEMILAVDDEASVLTMTKETLETFGYKVITARDGAEAVATYTAHRDEIRGVLTDMLMPHMDGPATIRVLKRIDPNVRVIATSGLLDGEKIRNATGMEQISFLMKPYTAEKLLNTVHRLLAEAA